MNNNNKFRILIIMALSTQMLSCGTTQTAIEKAEKARILDKQIENLDFKFNATYAYPQGFQSIYLSPLYDVIVSPDTVKAYLPYYGRAYRAPMNPSEGGIKFESTDFESKIEKGSKNGEWLVTIRTKDTSRPIMLYFHLWNNGTARLDVIDQDRQSISFGGDIEEPNLEIQKKPN